jgi:hypothetical protein
MRNHIEMLTHRLQDAETLCNVLAVGRGVPRELVGGRGGEMTTERLQDELTPPKIYPPNDSGQAMCLVRWMLDLPNGGWIGTFDREVIERVRRALAIAQAVEENKRGWPNLVGRIMRRADELLKEQRP